MSEASISVEHLSKSFGNKIVFDDCSFKIMQGSIFGLVGLNGMGKTTLIRLLLGLLHADKGTVSVIGYEPWHHDDHFYKQVGVVLEHDGFSGNLSVKDNLKIFAAAKGLSWAEIMLYVKEFWATTFIYSEVFTTQKKVKYFSRGQKMQCALCRAFLGWPKVYLFDEPTVALDVDAYDHFCHLSLLAQKRGSTILISSHQLSTIEELCDTIGIIENKKLHFLEDNHDASTPQQWILLSDGDEKYGTIIRQISGFQPSYHNGEWHFCVKEPQQIVPQIVRELACSGCRIREIRPEKHDLKGMIRRRYEKP